MGDMYNLCCSESNLGFRFRFVVNLLSVSFGICIWILWDGAAGVEYSITGEVETDVSPRYDGVELERDIPLPLKSSGVSEEGLIGLSSSQFGKSLGSCHVNSIGGGHIVVGCIG